MGLVLRRVGIVCATGLVAALAACQGSAGSGGLSIPQTSAYGNPNGPTAAQNTSRQQVLEGTVAIGPDLAELPLPTVAGFAVAIDLGATPRPAPSGSASAAPASTQAASPSPSPSPTASPSPVSSGSAAPAPSSSGSADGKTAVKTIIYPDDAPAAPTPAATGEVVTFVKRVALVRGFVQPATDVPLYGLGAVRFTIPSTEETAGRGFTIAAYRPAKKRHDALLASDASATLAGDTVTSSNATPLVLKKGVGYAFVLYADELPATPSPTSGSYSGTANNPFPTPTPTVFPGVAASPNPYGTTYPSGPPH